MHPANKQKKPWQRIFILSESMHVMMWCSQGMCFKVRVQYVLLLLLSITLCVVRSIFVLEWHGAPITPPTHTHTHIHTSSIEQCHPSHWKWAPQKPLIIIILPLTSPMAKWLQVPTANESTQQLNLHPTKRHLYETSLQFVMFKYILRSVTSEDEVQMPY